jgi:hypothetical protein
MSKTSTRRGSPARRASDPTAVVLCDAALSLLEQHLGSGSPELEAGPWNDFRKFLLGELSRSRPGFTTREYRTAVNVAISRALHAKGPGLQATLEPPSTTKQSTGTLRLRILAMRARSR